MTHSLTKQHIRLDIRPVFHACMVSFSVTGYLGYTGYTYSVTHRVLHIECIYSYTWLLTVTAGYLQLLSVTPGYLQLHQATYSYFQLHQATYS